jgi:hypothetical protein
MRLPPRVWRFLHSRRVWWAAAVSPFALGVIGAGYYGVVNWWSERKLVEQREWLAANGYAVTLEEYYPAAANPDEDVLQHPAVVAELAAAENLTRVHAGPLRSRLAGLARSLPKADPELGEREDVRAWFDPPRHATEAEAAREILEALSAEQQRMAGIVEALQRPRCAWELKDIGGLNSAIEQQNAMIRISGFARDLAVLHLAVGDSEVAAALLEAELKLVAHLYRHPSLFSCLSAQVVLERSQSILHEGVTRQAWSEGTLARLDAAIAALDPQAACIASMRGEIAMDLDVDAMLRVLQAADLQLLEGWELDGEVIVKRLRETWLVVRPVGTLKLELVEVQQQLVAETVAREGEPPGRFSRADFLEFERKEAMTRASSVIAPWGLLRAVANGSLESESLATLSRSGIALERYRLKFQTHPKGFASLVPEFLPAVPLDPCDLRPLRYRLLPDGSPLVWSVDLDGANNGGIRPKQRRSFRREPGYDRIWGTRPLPAAP